jgi:hypothetical protein
MHRGLFRSLLLLSTHWKLMKCDWSIRNTWVARHAVLIPNDISRDDDVLSAWIPQTPASEVLRITQEDVRHHMWIQALTKLPVNVSISTASKHMQDRVVWLSLLNDLKRSSVRGQSRQQQHIQDTVDSTKHLSPEWFGQFRLIQKCCNQLSQNAILALCNAVLLRRGSDSVLSSNAVFSKELIPDCANELAALVLPEEANDSVVLSLNKHLKLFEGLKRVAFLL